MKTMLFALALGCLMRSGLALYLYLSGNYDSARIPAVALMQGACLIATGLVLPNAKVTSVLVTFIGCLAIATLANTLSMPGMSLLDATIAQVSELSLPMASMLGIGLYLKRRPV